MQHVAIDLGGKESQLCVRASDGQILLEQKVATRTLETFFRRQPHSRVYLRLVPRLFMWRTLL